MGKQNFSPLELERSARAMPKDLLVGEMKIRDYGAVLALWKESKHIGLSAADSHELIARFLERNPGLSLVARKKGTVVGAVLGGHDGRRGYLHHLAVARKYRKKGIGHALVERVLVQMHSLGISKCHVFVFQKNISGQWFWQSIGWKARPELLVISWESNINWQTIPKRRKATESHRYQD